MEKEKSEEPEEEKLTKQIAKEPKRSEKEIPEKVKKELEQLKVKLQNLKKQLLKKYPFVVSIGLLPPQASKIIEEEEGIENKEEKEETKKLMHLFIIIPDEKAKHENKVKNEAIKLCENIKPKIWIHTKLIKDLWEICYDSKYDLIEAIAMSFPLYDKGILGSLRVSNIHKTLCLKKFERYIVSYVIAGSIVRGKTTKSSDIDVYIIVDDTDVKKMTRIELRDKLRSIVYGYAFEASELAGFSKNRLSPQIYLLTEFWEALRDANPIIFTFVRDGVPFYDRGTFMPWKLLLKMGKVTGTPEAIDRFMTLGEKTSEIIKRKLEDLATEEIYWGVITPSQAALMLYGLSPPTPVETVELMRKIFVEKEKLLMKKDIKILEKIVGIYKDFEHNRIKEINGKEIDNLLKESEEYRKRLKQLVEQIEKKVREKMILQIYDNTTSLIKNILGKTSESQIVKKFESEMIKKGKLSKTNLEILKDIIKAKKNYSKGKLGKKEVENIRKNARILINELTEYVQRQELEKTKKK